MNTGASERRAMLVPVQIHFAAVPIGLRARRVREEREPRDLLLCRWQAARVCCDIQVMPA
jgi:hypothetical protein